jgi:hypothetical protein
MQVKSAKPKTCTGTITVSRDQSRRLNGGQIEAKLKQLQGEYEQFHSMGAITPTQAVSNDVTKFMKSTATIAAFVMNTDDEKGGGGDHWITVLFEKQGKTIEVFDPFGVVGFGCLGTPVQEGIQNMLKSIPDRQVDCSPKKHQQYTTMCGMYCLYFIEQRLRGQSMVDFNTNNITDKSMFGLRARWFNFVTATFEPDKTMAGDMGGPIDFTGSDSD